MCILCGCQAGITLAQKTLAGSLERGASQTADDMAIAFVQRRLIVTSFVYILGQCWEDVPLPTEEEGGTRPKFPPPAAVLP